MLTPIRCARRSKRPADVGVDVLVIVAIAGLIAGAAILLGHAAAPRPQAVQISLSFWALPKYAFFSLSRAVIAYIISLVFTLLYGTIAAHSHTAERFMVPALDVLQSLPVLSFLPGLVLLFVRLFPTSWIGLELACVIMIFTAQVWNMTFSYFGSVRSIPTALSEAAAIQRLSGWQIFRYLELPASMIGLVWNSMMSMAGGWFIITVNEAFTLNNVDYRLPGLGSYMNQAQIDWNVPAMIAGVVAMILVIVLCDQVVWRPIVVWSQRFKLEDTASADQPKSWVLQMLKHSGLLHAIGGWWKRRHHDPTASTSHAWAAGVLHRRRTGTEIQHLRCHCQMAHRRRPRPPRRLGLRRTRPPHAPAPHPRNRRSKRLGLRLMGAAGSPSCARSPPSSSAPPGHSPPASSSDSIPAGPTAFSPSSRSSPASPLP